VNISSRLERCQQQRSYPKFVEGWLRRACASLVRCPPKSSVRFSPTKRTKTRSVEAFTPKRRNHARDSVSLLRRPSLTTGSDRCRALPALRDAASPAEERSAPRAPKKVRGDRSGREAITCRALVIVIGPLVKLVPVFPGKEDLRTAESSARRVQIQNATANANIEIHARFRGRAQKHCGSSQ
jgi:ferric-dicitrate binding protein FerR (iron transport regulator)